MWAVFAYGPLMEHLAEGVRSLGEGVHLRLGSTYSATDLWPLCDVVVVLGARPAQAAWMRRATSRGVPVVLVDLGYVDRFDHVDQSMERHLQVGVGTSLNWMPRDPRPSDRRDALGISYPGCTAPEDGYALVCGQVPGDPSHPHRSKAEVDDWMKSVASRLSVPDVRFRHHPRVEADQRPLEEDLRGARFVATWSSNTGHDALLAGVPVISEDGLYTREGPCPSLSGSGWSIEHVSFPDKDDWESYFDRLAYAQWTVEEMRRGDAFRHAKRIIDDDRRIRRRARRGRGKEASKEAA